MKISARNRLKGTIVDVTKGATTAHIRIDIGNGVVVGKTAYAVVKASDVMVATDD
jgi:molybdopterin-binding protein